MTAGEMTACLYDSWSYVSLLDDNWPTDSWVDDPWLDDNRSYFI